MSAMGFSISKPACPNATPNPDVGRPFADAHFDSASVNIKRREWIKRQTIEHRSLQDRKLAA